jgi:predicted metal-dependent hydrolase
LSTDVSDPVFTAAGKSRPLIVRRSAAARRMRLAIDPRDGTVRLTLPGRALLGPALRWAEEQRAWIEAALARTPAARPLAPGRSVPVRGRDLLIDHVGGSRRVAATGDRLIVGGPAELVPGRVLRWLRAEALRELDNSTRAFAVRAGVSVGRVRVGDPRTRWGSCSSSGDIAYSWRLILAPPKVLEATVAHEVAHRLHMHHRPEFHRAVAQLLGREPTSERSWLRAHGAALHAVGRSD